ncbi:smoothelin, like isoform X2 [Pristis pectinata]|uniref:smoothelin, like isoform X2 n=1 Tax=Pristis pectinata TaxID=685728 RepID=UPI00223CBD97|nr:smoothelin, like isoform X2 [Pristis pectinata]
MESGASVDPESLQQAVGYFEGALREAVKEVHVDIGALKRNVEQRMQELQQLVNPLSHTLARLQQENRELRDQVHCLSQQVERLTAAASGENRPAGRLVDAGQPAGVSSNGTVPACSPGEQVTEQNGMDAGRLTHIGAEVTSLHSVRGKEVTAPRNVSTLQHQPAAVGLAHLPITAVTKSGEKFSAEVSSSVTPRLESLSQPALNKPQTECVSQTAQQTDKNANISKTVSSTSQSTSSDLHSPTSVLDLYPGVTSKSRSPPPTVPRQGGKRPLLMRSQTLPRTSGPQSRKALFEKFEQEGSRGKIGESKGKLQRSQSFAVASASSIKQVLLEWCRSKTIGYKLIDIQNFSSSWSNGMAFCALIHSFFPESFDYNELNPSNRKQNFELAFSMAEWTLPLF